MLENQTPQSIPMCVEGSVLYWQGKAVEMRLSPNKRNAPWDATEKPSATRAIVHVANSTHLTSPTLVPCAPVTKLSKFQSECCLSSLTQWISQDFFFYLRVVFFPLQQPQPITTKRLLTHLPTINKLVCKNTTELTSRNLYTIYPVPCSICLAMGKLLPIATPSLALLFIHHHLTNTYWAPTMHKALGWYRVLSAG